MNGRKILDYISKDTLLSEKCFGVFAIDRLPLKKIAADNFCLCNTDLWENVGKHWILIYFPSQGPVEFFDPLGQKPSSQFEIFMGHSYMFNMRRFQPFNSISCAFYCIFFAYMKCHSIPFQNVLSLFGSERQVIKFVKML